MSTSFHHSQAPWRVILALADPADTTDRALPLACQLAQKTDAQLVLYHRIDAEGEMAESGRSLDMLGASLSDRYDLDVVAELHRGGDLADIGGTHSVLACVAASKGTVYAEDRYVSSATEYLVGELNCPVLVVGPNVDVSGLDIDAVVLAVDPANGDNDVAAMAMGLAGLIDVPVVMAQVHLAGETEPAEDADVRIASVKSRHQIADALIDLAGPRGLIAVTSHGRRGLERLSLGSIAADVVARSPMPVLVTHTTARL
jgi:nucleotide-binding universal stress UspA family protein